MRDASSEPGRVPPTGASDGEPTRTAPSRDRVGRPQLDDPPSLPQAPTDVIPPDALKDVASAEELAEVVSLQAQTDVIRHGPGVPTVSAARVGQAPELAGRAGQAPDLVRYGPGVPAAPPAGQPELTAERIWHTGAPGRPSRRRARLGRLSGWALTVILLAASGVLLFLRMHHAPFRVTGAVITQQTRAGCGVDVTGRIGTNGSAGTVSYQWLFRSGLQPPQPLSQSVVAGQRAVYVTVAVEGQGRGSASQMVTLQVLGPERAAASAAVAVSCP